MKENPLDSNIIAMTRFLSYIYIYKTQKNIFMGNGTVFSKTRMEMDVILPIIYPYFINT